MSSDSSSRLDLAGERERSLSLSLSFLDLEEYLEPDPYLLLGNRAFFRTEEVLVESPNTDLTLLSPK